MTIDIIGTDAGSVRVPTQREAQGAPLGAFPGARKAEAAFGIAEAIAETGSAIDTIGTFILEKDKEEEDALKRTEALAGFTKYQGEQRRRYAELSAQLSGTSASGFTETYAEELAKAKAAFLETIEEGELRDEFDLRVEQVNQGLHTKAFTDEQSIRRNYVVGQIGQAADELTFAIKTNSASAEAAMSIVEEMVRTSGLPEDQKEALAASINLRIKKSALAAETRIKAQQDAAQREVERKQAEAFRAQARNGAIVGKGQVTAWKNAPLMTRRLLQTLAATESPGYNVMFSPDGLRTFEDFSEHPNEGAVIPSGPNKGKISTAAGKYQITYPTWKFIQKSIPGGPLPDFSPESQDKAAWFLAQYEYAQDTGRDLSIDLLTPTPEVLAQVQESLQNRWEGAKKQGASGFSRAFLAGIEEKDGRDLLAAEGFEDIPLEERIAIITQEEDRSAKSVARARRMSEQVQRQQANSMLRQLQEGELTLKDINDAYDRGELNAEDLKVARSIKKEEIEAAEQAQALADKITDPSHEFRNTKEDRRAFAQAVPVENIVKGIQENDLGELTKNLPLLHRFRGTSQEPIVNAIGTASRSSNIDQMNTGFSAMVLMEDTLGEKFTDALEEGDIARFEAWKRFREVLTPEELVKRLNPNDPQLETRKAQLRENLEKEMRKKRGPKLRLEELLDTFDSFAGLAEVPNTLGLGGLFNTEDQPRAPLDPDRATLLMAEYRDLVTEQYAENGGDFQAAKQSAARLINRNWKITEFAGQRRLAKWPIETTDYPTFNGNYEWIEENIRAHLDLPETTGVYILGDGITSRENLLHKQDNSNPLPSYLVLVEQADGTYAPPADSKGFPLRMDFEYEELATVNKLDLEDQLIVEDLQDVQRRQQIIGADKEALKKEQKVLEERLRTVRDNREMWMNKWREGRKNNG